MTTLPSGRAMPIALRNEEGYLTVAEYLLHEGVIKDDRTNTGTQSKFGEVQVEYDLIDSHCQPTVCLPSTKKVFWRKAVAELIWMLSGSSRLAPLIKTDVTFWNNWVIPGTEVWEALDRPTSRLKFGTSSQRMKVRLLMRDVLGVPSSPNEDALIENIEAGIAFKLDTNSMTADQWEEVGMHMDLLGFPKRRLVDGDLGPVYGVQWRNWPDYRLIDPSVIYGSDAWAKYGSRGFEHVGTADNGQLMIGRHVDQIARLEAAIRDRDVSAARRIVLTAWNAAYIDDMALPPCHTLAQWCIEKDEYGADVLHCKLYQRSGDWFLGIPYNVAFYSIFTHMLCSVYKLKAGKLYHTVGDAHIYSNHVDQIKLQLAAQVNPDSKPLLSFNRLGSQKSILDFQVNDVVVDGYVPGQFIHALVAK